MEPTEIMADASSPRHIVLTYVPEANGQGNFAIHCTSVADRFGVNVDNVRVEEFGSIYAPKGVTDFVVTADQGLAGSYNHNILKIAEEELAKHPKRQLYVLGEVGRHYFEERGIEINKQFHYTIQNPTLNRARNISEELLEGYRQGDFDEIYIIYTSMVNAMQEEAEILQLLPLKKADFHNVEIPLDVRREELALRPSADAVMNRIVPDYVVGFVYGALVESFSCEQNARMMAMEAATNSAKDMLHELDIMYNRARQAAITQEITEVIAGAKSQKRKKKR